MRRSTTLRLDALIEGQWTTPSHCSLRALITPFGNRVRDLPPAQPAATARMAVTFVSDEAIGAGPGSPASGGAWNPHALQEWY